MPRVLLIEDNEANRDMLSRRLARRGYQISIATDGRQGIAAAQAEQPDLILMDMKSQPTTRHIPVIALTAHAMVSDRQRALEVGCDDYDTKPVELSRLLSKIAALIERENQR